MQQRTYRRGDLVIYRMSKQSLHPGPRARDVAPARFGDLYSYTVEKFWVVADVEPDAGTLRLVTRKGKAHRVDENDPNIRHANWWERWWYGRKFPSLDSLPEQTEG